MRYIAKKEPGRDVIHDAQLGIALRDMERPVSVLSRRTTRESVASAPFVRPSMDVRHTSRTDMSTGERILNHGFDFSTEEHGVAMRRMQTNLSERRQSSRHLALPREPKKKLSDVFSVRKGFLRRKPSSPKDED
jgi:phospholipid-translocating ATPase